MVGGKKQTLIPKKVAQISPKILNRIHFALLLKPSPSTAFPLAVIHGTFCPLIARVIFVYEFLRLYSMPRRPEGAQAIGGAKKWKILSLLEIYLHSLCLTVRRYQGGVKRAR